MLLPGCSCCGTCDACTRTCQNPHSGSAFATVYTRYFGGAEVGNPSDGYLNATGDSDTSDPYNGMDGTGPWYQRVSGGFSVGGAGDNSTRFPCTYRVSFWRNSYTLGAGTIPPASTALTENVIEVIVSTGALVFPDGRVITAADGVVALGTVPLVSGGGDASTLDPRSYEGTVSVAPQCMNVETIFTLRATIRWNTQKRQHVLYGLVRECYEDGTPCATVCGGSPSPSSVYLTISNYTGPTPSSGTVNGTYVLDRVKNYCEWYLGPWAWGCLPPGWPSQYYGGSDGVSAFMGVGGPTITASSWQTINGECRLLVLWINTSYNPTTLSSFCGPGIFGTGTNGVVLLATTIPPTPSDIVSGSFNWKIES